MVAAAVIGTLALASIYSRVAEASAPSGLPAAFASSSLQTVSASAASTITATTTWCSSRVITTTGRDVMLTFDDAKTPTGLFGHYQAASTTVAYDSGIYGCGAIKGFARDANTSVTVSIFQ